MSSGPRVSVQMPAYNQIRYIDEAITSAVEQDYDNLEIVIGDDGSTDGTAERILEFARRFPGRITPMVGLPHAGITGNTNRVMKACRASKYVALFAGDDVMLPGKIRKQVEWLEQSESRVLCAHEVESFDSDTGRTIAVTSQCSSGRGAGRLLEVFDSLPGLGLMLRSSAIPPDSIDPRVTVVSDYKLQIDCLAAGGEYGFIDGVYARYRVHSGSVSQRSRIDADVHQAYFEGFLTTFALVEAEYPHLAAAAARARGRLLLSEARWRAQRHELHEARSYYRAAIRQNLAMLPKALAGLTLARMPAALRGGVERMLRKYRQK